MTLPQRPEKGPRSAPGPDLFCAWNWKCALMSAVARSAVYAIAMARHHGEESLAVIAVEMVYVTLTAGLYAGLQQMALGVRRRWLGDLAIVAGVPGLSQLVDWMVHKAVGAPMPHRALLSVCVFTLISALFHRHVMRRGTFLTGERAGSMADDFRRIPGLLLSFVLWPAQFAQTLPGKLARAGSPEDAEAAA